MTQIDNMYNHIFAIFKDRSYTKLFCMFLDNLLIVISVHNIGETNAFCVYETKHTINGDLKLLIYIRFK